MASPGQKHGSCGHVMAVFNQNSKYMWYCDKGMGTDPCVMKADSFLYVTSDQQSQLATPTYKSRKERKSASPFPSVVDPGSVQILRQVENSKRAENVTTTKKKTTPTKETRKESSFKSSSSTGSAY